MSDNTLETKTQDNDVSDANYVSEDDKVDKPTNTKPLNINNDTVIKIEDEVKGPKGSEAEQLKQAVFRDQGMQSVYVIDGIGKTHAPNRDNNYTNRQVWVQAMFVQASGVEMGEASRGPFIRKVFALLFFCMLFTSICTASSFFLPGIRLFFQSLLGLVLAIVAFVVGCGLTCAIYSSDCARKPPGNYICLCLAVICETVFCMWITAQYSLNLVFTAMFVTTLVVLLCFCLAFTGFDFTKFLMFVIVIMFVVIAFFVVVIILALVFQQKFTILFLILSFVMTLVQSVLFIIEIQMVLGGKTIELGEDDYVLGTFMLYTSIMDLFQWILCLLQLFQDLDI